MARALHVIAVVLWIGGVGFVTTALLPAIRRLDGADAMAVFAMSLVTVAGAVAGSHGVLLFGS